MQTSVGPLMQKKIKKIELAKIQSDEKPRRHHSKSITPQYYAESELTPGDKGSSARERRSPGNLLTSIRPSILGEKRRTGRADEI